MSWWAVGAAVVGAVASSDSARSAANKANDGTQASISEQQRQYDQTRADYAPWREAGARALANYETAISAPTTAADVMADPGYQFGLQQGQRALDSKFSAAGGRVSGAAMKQASRYSTDYASTKYNEVYQRAQDRLNRLASLANLGQTATSGSAAAGASSANAISSALTSGADTSAAARLAQGNIWTSTGNNIAAILARNNRTSQSSGWGTSGLNNFYYGNGTSGD